MRRLLVEGYMIWHRKSEKNKNIYKCNQKFVFFICDFDLPIEKHTNMSYNKKNKRATCLRYSLMP